MWKNRFQRIAFSKIIAVCLAVSLLMGSIAGCKPGNNNSSNNSNNSNNSNSSISNNSNSSNSSSRSEAPDKLTIGIMSDVGAVPFLMAQELGFYKKRGLSVNLQVFKSAVDRDTALQTGNLDGAMADMLTLLFFSEAGVDVKMTSDTYGNYRMISAPKLDADSFQKLPSKSIGVSSNTVIEFATQRIADKKGFSSALLLVAIPQMPVRLEMLTAGKLDGATLPEPLASAAIGSGGVEVGSTRDLGLFPANVIMTQAALNTNPQRIRLLYEAYDEAVQYLNSRKATEYFDVLIEKLGFPAVLKGTFVMPKFEKTSPPDEKTFNEVSTWMFAKGLIKKTPAFASLYDNSWE